MTWKVHPPVAAVLRVPVIIACVAVNIACNVSGGLWVGFFKVGMKLDDLRWRLDQ